MAKIEAKNLDDKTCESCGKPFGCGAKLESCWCSERSVPAEIAAGLKSQYKDCLCPDCLQYLSSGDAVVVSYPNATTEIIFGAVRVDTRNYHEGMIDFYDGRGNLLKQISMDADTSWETMNLISGVGEAK